MNSQTLVAGLIKATVGVVVYLGHTEGDPSSVEADSVRMEYFARYREGQDSEDRPIWKLIKVVNNGRLAPDVDQPVVIELDRNRRYVILGKADWVSGSKS